VPITQKKSFSKECLALTNWNKQFSKLRGLTSPAHLFIHWLFATRFLKLSHTPSVPLKVSFYVSQTFSLTIRLIQFFCINIIHLFMTYFINTIL
jgi:hypothetical protein